MNKKGYGYLSLAVTTLLTTIITSCSNKELRSRADGEITEDISALVKSFDSDDISIGAVSDIKSANGIVFISNSQSIDSLIAIFDSQTLSWKGNIAKVGPGPDEITVPGEVVYDDKRNELLVFDYGQLKVKAFNVDSALNQEYYSPRIIQTIQQGTFPDRYAMVNDSLGFARMISLPKNPRERRGYEQTLCKYNLKTGEMKEIPDSGRMAGLKTLFGINADCKRLVECGINNDLLTIYDFEGNKLRTIPGPEYKNDGIDKKKIYFRQIVVTPELILASYSGSDDDKTNYYGRTVQVYDIDGNYIKTLDSGKLISHMNYDKNTGRLLMIFNDPDIQLGYVDLNKVIN
ncbi:MAG: TolB-like 6-bladed beta-propeller domain-containing protein [Duncaniella sp.]|nr:TolB-like 6-bladed beta-propeller domain-containing protein [Duncaniella sp.]